MGDFMPILFILTLVAQTFCTVHVVRTGRENTGLGLLLWCLV